LTLTANTCRAPHGQRQLLPEQSRRDTDAANRALARLRAECGEQNVVRAHIRDAHLPSARFVWEPLAGLSPHAAPRVVALRPLVRRIYTQAVALPGFSLEPGDKVFDAAEVRRPTPVARSPLPVVRSPSSVAIHGPYVVSGGWWGGGVDRDYYFVHTPTGELRWIYYDRRRTRFYLQGHVQ
jgi:protein ImuB